MPQFDYIAVLVSVIAGLGIVHLLSGVAVFLVADSLHRPYWVHLLWTWNVFHFIVYYWWFVWRWSALTEWQLLIYFFILLYAVCLYLMCAVLYPPATKDVADYRSIYYKNSRVFFLLWVLAVILDMVDTHLKVQMGLSGFGNTLIAIWSLLIVGSLIAAKVQSHAYHAAWSLIFFAIMAYFELANFTVLRAN